MTILEANCCLPYDKNTTLLGNWTSNYLIYAANKLDQISRELSALNLCC